MTIQSRWHLPIYKVLSQLAFTYKLNVDGHWCENVSFEWRYASAPAAVALCVCVHACVFYHVAMLVLCWRSPLSLLAQDFSHPVCPIKYPDASKIMAFLFFLFIQTSKTFLVLCSRFHSFWYGPHSSTLCIQLKLRLCFTLTSTEMWNSFLTSFWLETTISYEINCRTSS